MPLPFTKKTQANPQPSPGATGLPIQARVAAHPDVKGPLAAVKAAQAAYGDQYVALAGFLDEPTARQVECATADLMRESVRLRNGDAAGQAAALTKLAEFHDEQLSPGYKLAREAALGTLRRERDKVGSALCVLLKAAIGVIGTLRTEAERAESEFFGQFGLPRTATAVSSRINQAEATLKAWLGDLESPAFFNASHIPNPPCYGTISAWFGRA
jgi:hypothetical protein